MRKMIGLVLRDLKQPFFSMVVHSVEQRASELGYHLLLSSSSEISTGKKKIERFSRSRRAGSDYCIAFV